MADSASREICWIELQAESGFTLLRIEVVVEKGQALHALALGAEYHAVGINEGALTKPKGGEFEICIALSADILLFVIEQAVASWGLADAVGQSEARDATGTA